MDGKSGIKAKLTSIIAAVDLEILALKEDMGEFDVEDGIRQSRTSEGSVYKFRTQAQPLITPDTPITLEIKNSLPVKGHVIDFEEPDIILLLCKDIGDTIEKAKVRYSPAFIMEELRNRLSEIALNDDLDSPIISALLGDSITPVVDDAKTVTSLEKAFRAEELPKFIPNDAKKKALSKCLGSQVHYVWGPPGTGKTDNIAQLTRALTLKGEKVLILCTANIANDNAILRIISAFEKTDLYYQDKILRVGYPRLDNVRKNDHIIPFLVVKRNHPELFEEQDRLYKIRGKLKDEIRRGIKTASGNRDPHAEIEKIRKRLDEIKSEIKIAISLYISRASVIATTLALYTLNNDIWSWPFDAVIIDEASMAGIPYVIAAAHQTKKRISLFGDFRQLEPICKSNDPHAVEWLKRDVFDVSGIKKTIDAGKNDGRITMLDVQYRMVPEIAEVVSRFAYTGRLKTDQSAIPQKSTNARKVPPVKGAPLVLLDTSKMKTGCIKDPSGNSYSRINILSLALAACVTARMSSSAQNKAAILSPYTRQAFYMSKVASHSNSLSGALASTVHKSQGSEKECVVFDLVDAPPLAYPSMLTGREPDKALRMLNVAISRAKGKLVFIADCNSVRAKHLNGSMSRKLLDLIKEHGEVVTPEPSDISTLVGNDPFLWEPGWNAMQDRMAADLSSLSCPLVISVPEGFVFSTTFIDALRRYSERGIMVKISGDQRLRAGFGNLNRIQFAGPGRRPWFSAIFEQKKLYFGGTAMDGAFCGTSNRDIIKDLSRIAAGDNYLRMVLYSEKAAELAALLGKCPVCRKDRRFKSGTKHLMLTCGMDGHRPQNISGNDLAKVIDVLDMRCMECGSPAKVAQRRDGSVFISCSGYSRGCSGYPPYIQQLI